MLRDDFYNKVDELQQKIKDTQQENMTKAAMMIADSIATGGGWHIFDTGHLINAELMNRAGGFNLVRAFKYNLNVETKARKRDIEKETSMEGLAKFALRQANIYPNDVMVIGSVSGKTPNVIDLALTCKEMGIKTIALTSVTYSSQLDCEHSSGLHLYDIADVVIDNCAPFGDGMIKVEGIEKPFIPASGLAAAYIMWSITADVLDNLLAKGLTPGILGSVNKPDNRQYNIDLEKTYLEDGI